MSTIELSGLRKSFGSVAVIHGIELTVAEGEFLALVGPSGCGKSTLLRMIAGLEDISAGEIRIDGKRVNHIDPKGRNVAMVFQNYALYPHMTVRENISLNLRISRVAKDEIARRVAEAARLLDIEPLMDRRPSQLSGGQRQRVAMGRAIVRNPAVFLFDEPLSNLDAKLRVQMRSEIKSFHQKMPTTSIYVTHDQIEAMTLADRVVVLNGGRIEQVGSPIDLYLKPCNLFVAGFIGSPAMNFLPATADLDDVGNPVARLPTGQFVRLTQNLALAPGLPLVLGLRPEHLSLSGPGTALPARVSHVEPTGAQTHLLLDFAGVSLVAVINDFCRLKRGDDLQVGIDPSRLHVFSDASGHRLGD